MKTVYVQKAHAAAAPRATNGVVHVGKEHHKLNTVALWGKPSTETVLARLFPPELSLLSEKMDVLKARKETEAVAQKLLHHGANVVIGRDVLAKIAGEPKESEAKVLEALLRKGERIMDAYGSNGYGRNEALELLEHLFKEDVKRYGPQGVTMTAMLALDHEIPLGNMLFARDQSNVIMGTRFSASMAKDARKPEVVVWETIYQNGMGLPAPVVMDKGMVFEGGSAFVAWNNGVPMLVIDDGPRTNIQAVSKIIGTLAPSYPDMKFMVVHSDNGNLSFVEQQMNMHADCKLMSIGDGQMLAVASVAEKDKAFEGFLQDGKVVIKDTGMSVMDFLVHQGYEVFGVPAERHSALDCNILVIDGKNVMISLNDGTETIKQLEAAGKNVIAMDVPNVVNGFGGVHCLAMALRRGNAPGY